MIDRILPNMPPAGLRLADAERLRPADPETLLAAAVLERAALDWRALRHLPDRHTLELRQFFGGAAFVLYCDLLGLDSDWLHREICRNGA